MRHSGRSIIMRRHAYGEADWIVTFFSREAGRLSGIARSARASMRRFGGALEPGSVVDMSFTRRRASELVRLEEAHVRLPMNGAMKSLERIGGVARALALALAFLQENEPNPEKFDLLSSWLAGLSGSDPAPFDTAAFELRWLALCGFAPVLDRCASCGTRMDMAGAGWSFDFDRAGLACGTCAGRGASVSLSPRARAGLAALAAGDAGADDASAQAALAILGRYVDHILGRPLSVR